MSIWTHVAAVFRFDYINEDLLGPCINGYRKPKWDKVTKRAIYDCDWLSEDDYEIRRMEDDWEAYEKHPNMFMPTGSEGSLQRLVHINPDRSSAARYVVSVFGDLRDYENHEAIRQWFEDVCSRGVIRQAVCHCNVEGVGEYEWHHSWMWPEDEQLSKEDES